MNNSFLYSFVSSIYNRGKNEMDAKTDLDRVGQGKE
jgi:hypothetical protein